MIWGQSTNQAEGMVNAKALGQEHAWCGVRTEKQPAGLEQREVRGGLGLGEGLGFDFK